MPTPTETQREFARDMDAKIRKGSKVCVKKGAMIFSTSARLKGEAKKDRVVTVHRVEPTERRIGHGYRTYGMDGAERVLLEEKFYQNDRAKYFVLIRLAPKTMR